MGTNNIVMLSVFDRSFFPSAFGSRHMSPFHGNEDMFLGLPNLREPTFAGLEAQREKFLNEMNEQNEQGDGMSQSYSFSSSTVQHGDSAPVVQRREELRMSDGNVISRSRKSVGDQSVETTLRGGETTRTLTNIAEDEVERFEQTISERQHAWSPFTAQNNTAAALTAPLENDLARIQQ